MGRLTHRQTGTMGAELRLVTAGQAHVLVRCWQMLVLLAMTALTWACGSEAVCPAGAGGSPCIPTDDLGAAPEVPMSSRDRAMDTSETEAPDAGADDAEGSETDISTTEFKRDAPCALRAASPRDWEREAWFAARYGHATEHERAAECAAQPGQHVDSRGRPSWRSYHHVTRVHGPVGWRRAA